MELEELVRAVYQPLPKLKTEEAQESRIQAAIALAKELQEAGWSFTLNAECLNAQTPSLTFYEEKWHPDQKASSRYKITVRPYKHPDHKEKIMELRVAALDPGPDWPSPHPHVHYLGGPCMGAQYRIVLVMEPFIVAQTVANMLNGPCINMYAHHHMYKFLPSVRCYWCGEFVPKASVVKDNNNHYYHEQCSKAKEQEEELARNKTLNPQPSTLNLEMAED